MRGWAPLGKRLAPGNPSPLTHFPQPGPSGATVGSSRGGTRLPDGRSAPALCRGLGKAPHPTALCCVPTRQVLTYLLLAAASSARLHPPPHCSGVPVPVPFSQSPWSQQSMGSADPEGPMTKLCAVRGNPATPAITVTPRCTQPCPPVPVRQHSMAPQPHCL